MLYGVAALSVFAVYPGLAQQFTSANLSGYTLCSMPVEELLWALGYNLIALPAAALGYIQPWMAAIGMSASSLLVVANALRLVEKKSDQ